MQVPRGARPTKSASIPSVSPRPVLDGEVNIDSASYALQSASARMPKGVNVNWIKHLMLENENRLVADSTLVPRPRPGVGRILRSPTGDSSKLTSFIGTREVVYSDVRVGEFRFPTKSLRMDNNVVVGDEEPESAARTKPSGSRCAPTG